MPDINPSVPVVGQPDSSEEPKIVTALTQLIAAVNNVDTDQIADGTLEAADLGSSLATLLGVTAGGVTRRATSIIDTAETITTGATWMTMPTPDRVTVDVPANGLLFIAWQVKILTNIGLGFGPWVDNVQPFAMTGGGMASTAGAYYLLGSQTPQGGGSIGIDPGGTGPRLAFQGIPVLTVSPGSHQVDLRYRLDSAGSVTTKERKLWVWTQGP